MKAFLEWLATARLDVSFHIGQDVEDTPTPNGDCYATTERSESYPVGFRVEPVD